VDDRDLMERLAAGDREALAPLMERHATRLYRISLSYLRDPEDALDCVQEAFVKAFQHAGRWDRRAEVVPWLTRIAINQAIDTYRKTRRRVATEAPLGDDDHDERLVMEDPSPERHAIGRETGERIQAALLALPAGQRAVFLLRHQEGLTLPEIAAALNMRLGTVKSSLHRAIRGLRQRLEGLRA
jgi:RNA polymerase sigma-70 factor (ECF subfamily)